MPLEPDVDALLPEELEDELLDDEELDELDELDELLEDELDEEELDEPPDEEPCPCVVAQTGM